MLILVEENYEALSREAARIVANAILRKPDVRLGLATGSTPLGVYRELVRLHREEGLDFSCVLSFNLDEYIGLPADHPQSFHSYMRQNLFDHINLREENVHIPDGNWSGKCTEYCAHYETLIARACGIDLQVLGIGKDGHIGFNEPTSSLASRTRPKTLTRQTMEDNRADFASERAASGGGHYDGNRHDSGGAKDLITGFRRGQSKGGRAGCGRADHGVGFSVGAAASPRHYIVTRSRSGGGFAPPRLLPASGRNDPQTQSRAPVVTSENVTIRQERPRLVRFGGAFGSLP